MLKISSTSAVNHSMTFFCLRIKVWVFHGRTRCCCSTYELPEAIPQVFLSVSGVPGIASQQDLGHNRKPWTQVLQIDQQGESTLALTQLLHSLISHPRWATPSPRAWCQNAPQAYLIFLGSLLQQHYLLHCVMLLGPEGRRDADTSRVGVRSAARGLSWVFAHMGTVFPPNSIQVLPVLRDEH